MNIYGMIWGSLIFFWSLIIALPSANALTVGKEYTVEVAPILPNGTIGAAVSSATATADTNGKITFNLTSIPDRSSYNFMLVTIKNPDGTTARRSLVPAPASGSTNQLGVSEMTEGQTQAMLTAMEVAGSDDPIMVLFGFTLIRSGGYSSVDIVHLGNLGRSAVRDSGGFNDYLQGKVGMTKMASFRSEVQYRLGQYTAKIKSSVDSITDATAAKNARGEAASLLSQLLIDAAKAADIDPGYINAAMRSMGDKAEDYLVSNSLSENVVASIDAIMMSTYQKISAEVVRKKYTSALTALGASQSQIDRLNAAVTNLSNTMLEIFQEFEELFKDEANMPSKSAIEDKQQELFGGSTSRVSQAFNNFIIDSASSKAEIDDMVNSMKTGFCDILPEPGKTGCRTALVAMKDPNSDGTYTDGMFVFRDMSGETRMWPITMVVPVTWVSTHYPQTFSYTRDTLQVPAAMSWLDSDDNPGNGFNRKRHDFDDQDLNGVVGDEKNMPSALAALFGLREDMEIIQNRRWAGEIAASCDMLQSAYSALTGTDQSEADALIASGSLTLIASEDTAAQDDADGITITSFNHCNDLSPYLLATEIQGLEDLLMTRRTQRMEEIGPAAITDAQRLALIDTATMPSF